MFELEKNDQRKIFFLIVGVGGLTPETHPFRTSH